MADELRIPADMNDYEMARKLGAKAVVSIRDMMLLLGASDEQLRKCDERKEILKREPWRIMREQIGKARPNGMTPMRVTVDWSGTKFAEV